MPEQSRRGREQPDFAAPEGASLALERGREQYAARAWEQAYLALAEADSAQALEAPDLERLAWAAALTGRDDELLALLERLYQGHLDCGASAAAARFAFFIGYRLANLDRIGAASAWLTRAQRLVEGCECVVTGYLLIPEVRRLFGMGQLDAAYAAATRAAEIGERFAEKDLSVFARNLQGRVLLRQGRLDQGLPLLDEAMLSALRGELTPLFTGLVYCSALASCQSVYALQRSREWSAAIARWVEDQPELVTFTGACRVHRASIMRLGGAWREALEQAQRACENRSGALDPAAGDAFYEQAEIHRLRGEHALAEEAYRHAHQFGREPEPGFALLRLAQGRVEAARSSIRRVLAAAEDPLARARLLPACIEISIAKGALDDAQRACNDLEGILAQFESEVLGAIAAQARGAFDLASGHPEAALPALRRALRVWQRVGAPYDEAQTRVLLARACLALSDGDAATLELDAASELYGRLAAAPGLARVDELRPKPAAAPSHGLTGRELEVLRLVAAGNTNKSIARALFLSEKTVDRHLSNIFTKLGVASRAAATAYAYENKLI